MSAAAERRPKLRWLIRRILLLRPSRRPLESPRRIAARIPWRWARGCGPARRTGRAASGRPRPARRRGARGPGPPGGGGGGGGRGDEGGEPRAGGPGQPGVEVRGGQARILEVVEQPQLLAQQEGAVRRLACWTSSSVASWRRLWRSGALSS